MLTVLMLLAAVQPAADRRAWLYAEGGSPGYFLTEDGRRWVERTTRGDLFQFRETRRTAEAVELLDGSRDVAVRLTADRMAWRRGEAGDWNVTNPGKWVTPADLPKAGRPGGYRVKLVYFVAADREPTADYEAKVRTVAAVVADTFRLGLDGVTPAAPLRFEAGDGGPRVHLVRGKHPAAHYSGSPKFNDMLHFMRVVGELPPALGAPAEQAFLVLAETYDPGPAPVEWNGSVGRGGRFGTAGGVGVMSAWVLRDEFCATTVERQKMLLFDPTPMTGRTALHTRRPDSPRFEFIEDGFGAAAHELGHALGLPHDVRFAGDIMGHGFRDLRKNYETGRPTPAPVRFSADNARLLAASPYLSPDHDPTDLFPPELDGSTEVVGGKVRLTVTAKDNRGLKALVVLDLRADSLVGGAALAGTRQSVTFEFPTTGDFKLRVTAADRGGHHATAEFAGKPAD